VDKFGYKWARGTRLPSKEDDTGIFEDDAEEENDLPDLSEAL